MIATIDPSTGTYEFDQQEIQLFNDWDGYDLEGLLLDEQQQQAQATDEASNNAFNADLDKEQQQQPLVEEFSPPSYVPAARQSTLKTSRTLTLSSGSNRDTNKSKVRFLENLKEVLSDPENLPAISWLPHGKAFQIRNQGQFRFLCRRKLGLSLKVFTKKLETWGFRELTHKCDAGAFYHPLFARDEPTTRIKSQRHSARTGLILDEPEPNFYRYAMTPVTPAGGARPVTPPPPPIVPVPMMQTMSAPSAAAAAWYGASMFAATSYPYVTVVPMVAISGVTM